LTTGLGTGGGASWEVFAAAGVEAFGGGLFGATTLGAEAFRTGIEAAFEAGIGFVAVADFAVTVFTGTGFAMAFVDFGLVAVVLILSTSTGSGTIFLGLPLFFATTSADMFYMIFVALMKFDAKVKMLIIQFGASCRGVNGTNALPRNLYPTARCKINYQLQLTSWRIEKQ